VFFVRELRASSSCSGAGQSSFKTDVLLDGLCLVLEGLLYLRYVKYGKFRHRDHMLSLHQWRGHEQVLDVGCGRGLLIAGVAKRLAKLDKSGHVTGIDIWSTKDMGGNSEEAPS
jgi:SAM-dependent methyltransferase